MAYHSTLTAELQHHPLLYGVPLYAEPDLISKAIESGFRGFDSARRFASRTDEKAVGDALRRTLVERGIPRESIYIQTRLPPSIFQQGQQGQILDLAIETSVNQSLEDLQVEYLDSLILYRTHGGIIKTEFIWKAMEKLVPSKTKSLGLFLATRKDLEDLWSFATIKPSVVQNPFYYSAGEGLYDLSVRRFCAERDITYQAFFVLKCNKRLLHSQLLCWFADHNKMSVEQALYCFVLALERPRTDSPGCRMTILNGTTKSSRMLADLKSIAAHTDMDEFLVEAFVELLHEENVLQTTLAP